MNTLKLMQTKGQLVGESDGKQSKESTNLETLKQLNTDKATYAEMFQNVCQHYIDPWERTWERTGAAPHGWTNHLQQSLLPIQGFFFA